MGFLTLAGAISGAGQAGQTAFQDMARFTAADMMERRRQEMDLQKQERMLEAQREMNRETIAATSKEKGMDRSLSRDLQSTELQSREAIAQGQNETTTAIHKRDREARSEEAKAAILSNEKIAELTTQANKDIAAGHDANQKDIAKLNAATNQSIQKADRLMKKYEIEQTAENSTKLATSRALTEIGNETTRLTALLANPMLDPATTKALQERLNKLERIHDAYSRSMLPEGEKGAAASTGQKTLPPFQFPKGIPAPSSGSLKPAYPGAFNAPGVKVLPLPGQAEQDAMGRALNP